MSNESIENQGLPVNPGLGRMTSAISQNRPRRSASRWNYRTVQNLSGFLFVLPVLVFFAIFNVYPIVNAFFVSFFEFDLFSPMKFIGLENYLDLLTDANFWSALRVTVLYTVLFAPPAWAIGFGLALLLREKIFARDVFRSIFYLPTILSAVAMAVAWSLLLRINGPLNAVLNIYVPWLTNENYALLGIVIMSIWQSAGWFMVVFLAGLAGIPDEYYEAAKLDGANRWQSLRFITAPLIKPVFAVIAIQTMVSGMKVFTPMFIMTGGGPNNSTRSFAMLIYHTGIRDFRMGLADAISFVGFVAILCLTILQLRLFRVGEEVSE